MSKELKNAIRFLKEITMYNNVKSEIITLIDNWSGEKALTGLEIAHALSKMQSYYHFTPKGKRVVDPHPSYKIDRGYPKFWRAVSIVANSEIARLKK